MELREKRRGKKKEKLGEREQPRQISLLAFELSQSKETQAGDGGRAASLRTGESWKSLCWLVSVVGFFMEDGGGFMGLWVHLSLMSHQSQIHKHLICG